MNLLWFKKIQDWRSIADTFIVDKKFATMALSQMTFLQNDIMQLNNIKCQWLYDYQIINVSFCHFAGLGQVEICWYFSVLLFDIGRPTDNMCNSIFYDKQIFSHVY